jgi:membrane protease YdiL (CAAX protease family)
MKEYFKHTSSLLFGVIVSIPLAIYYEISMILANRGMEADVRNAADVMFKRLFESIGYDGPLAGVIMFAFLFIIAAIVQGAHKEKEGIRIQWQFYPVLIAESGLYAMLLFALMAISMNAMAPAMALSPIDIGYCLGAGVYEELLFRAILLSGLLFLAGLIKKNTLLWKILAVVISALIFAGAHYIGAAGDSFMWASFLTRTVGGLLLGFVFMFRGLGAAVYTHAIYDIYTIVL